MRILNVFFLLFSMAFWGQQQELSSGEIKEFQEQVLSRARELKTLQADFDQQKKLEMINGEAQSKGKVYYQEPQWLKWEYSQPYLYSVLFRDGQLYIDDEGNKSIQPAGTNSLIEKLGKLVSGSLNGNLLQEAENLNVTYYRDGGSIFASVEPLDEKLSRLFREILLEFDQQYLIRSIQLNEDSGDFTLIQFTDVRINQPIDPLVFEQ